MRIEPASAARFLRCETREEFLRCNLPVHAAEAVSPLEGKSFQYLLRSDARIAKLLHDCEDCRPLGQARPGLSVDRHVVLAGVPATGLPLGLLLFVKLNLIFRRFGQGDHLLHIQK